MTHNGLRPVELLIPITADFVPVFVFCANLYTSPRPIFIVITPAVVALHPPVATDCTMIRVVVVVVHPTHTPLAHSVAVALHSPVAADLDILSRLPFLVSGLLRLPRTAFWLNGRQLWRVGGWGISNCLLATRGLLSVRSARRIRGSCRLVLFADVSGRSRVAGLNTFVDLLGGHAGLLPLVYLLLGQLTRCGLWLLLCRRREGYRASCNDNHR